LDSEGVCADGRTPEVKRLHEIRQGMRNMINDCIIVLMMMIIVFIYFQEAIVQHEYSVTVNYTLESMGDRDYRTVCEFRSNCFLNKIVCSMKLIKLHVITVKLKLV